MADNTDVSQLPTDAVNSPASGVYGEKAAQQRLEQQLPSAPTPGAGSGPGAMPPMPVPQGNAGISTPPSGGVPAGILAPTAQPGTPMTTPLQAAPVNPMQSLQSGRQQRLAQLDALAQNPNNSDETRQWAKEQISQLIGLSTR